MRKHETAVCGTARTVVWEVGKCENRRKMPFMISIYLLPDCNAGVFLEVLKVLEVDHALSAFKSSLNHNSPESRFLPILWSSLMTGACHLLRPASVVIDDRLLAQEDCSFDCRCKDTKIRSRKQAFSRRMLGNSA